MTVIATVCTRHGHVRVRCYDVRVCVNWNFAIVVDPGLNCMKTHKVIVNLYYSSLQVTQSL